MYLTLDQNISGDAVSEPQKMLESEKGGRLQAVSKESTKVSRRTPRKRVVATEPIDDISEVAPITETVLAASNQTLVDYQVIENFKHTNALRSVSEFTDLSRRTPKKQLISEKMIEKSFTEEKREERDVLKEMFPYEVLTPTGISASCRRPIKGAAGRPFSVKDYKDYKVEESYSKYISKYQPVVEEKTTKVKSGRSIPIWIKLLLLLILAVLAFLVYQAMETNEGNPFTKWLQGNQNLSKDEN